MSFENDVNKRVMEKIAIISGHNLTPTPKNTTLGARATYPGNIEYGLLHGGITDFVPGDAGSHGSHSVRNFMPKPALGKLSPTEAAGRLELIDQYMGNLSDSMATEGTVYEQPGWWKNMNDLPGRPPQNVVDLGDGEAFIPRDALSGRTSNVATTATDLAEGTAGHTRRTGRQLADIFGRHPQTHGLADLVDEAGRVMSESDLARKVEQAASIPAMSTPTIFEREMAERAANSGLRGMFRRGAGALEDLGLAGLAKLKKLLGR